MPSCRGLGKTFRIDGRNVVALRDVDLDLPRASISVFVGPSGCGKTTLLRLLAGLEQPTSGVILRDGAEPSQAAAERTRVGYVFQEPRLMPWLSVARNVGFNLEGRLPKVEIATRVADILSIMGLTTFASARPDQLSGGMASRVGLARALVSNPDLLLLDEPFAALDAMTRRRLQAELVALWQRLSPTIVFVTHDVEEAALLADTVYRMESGAIVARYPNSIPRPRDATDAGIVALRRAILAGLEEKAEPTSVQPSTLKRGTAS
ncbi:ABC transporter ATP-binding protein [Xanthobacteraceae bacterium Astr-EGSB]|uniref:ABC transporter ATP-binding protein n=1 Tax=Astrobacterium formosum TaxID=3069710 RepID=UPI0027B29DA4|nr:ABC transporter ATP-binding protein [Xanthobacteraceae bacterium Astr-EGSB]